MKAEAAFAALREANPVPDAARFDETRDSSVAFLSATMERSEGMDTLEHTETTRRTSRRWQPAIAIAAFLIVVAVGIALAVAIRSSSEVADIPAPPFENAEEAAQAFAVLTSEGTLEDFEQIFEPDGNRGRDAAEAEESFRFHRALGFQTELGECTVNSVTSVTCEETGSSREIELLSGGPDIGLLTIRVGETGRISSWKRDVPRGVEPGLWLEFSEWVRTGNSLPWIELVPDVDSTSQLDISPEAAAERYVAEIERFLAEHNG